MCFLLDIWRSASALLLAAALASPAGAVVISAGNDTPNLAAPGNDPGWNNVGRVATASGVYLGNRWVITAGHVSQGGLRLSDGREFAMSVGSNVQLSNAETPAPFGEPDLRMFRLAEDPGLAALEIGQAAPALGDLVIMIGAGVDRAGELIGWQTTSTVAGLQWDEVPVTAATVLGHTLLSSSHMRWGANFVASGTTFRSDLTFAFSTQFDRLSLSFEAQATLGDSGGGVFRESDDGWELLGIMTSNQLLGNQPSNTVVYGDQTIIADLSVYREQILGLVNRQEPLWQNQVDYFDVSGDGHISPRDFLLLVTELRAGPHSLSGAPGASDGFYDVTGDYEVTTADSQAVVNRLLSGGAFSASSPAAGVNFVPEPGGVSLALWGLLSAALARIVAGGRISRARRRWR
jgi:hypothetical protein